MVVDCLDYMKVNKTSKWKLKFGYIFFNRENDALDINCAWIQCNNNKWIEYNWNIIWKRCSHSDFCLSPLIISANRRHSIITIVLFYRHPNGIQIEIDRWINCIPSCLTYLSLTLCRTLPVSCLLQFTICNIIK